MLMPGIMLCTGVIFDLFIGSHIGHQIKLHDIDLWLLTMPTWSLADVEKELKDASAFLGQKKASSGAQSATAMEENLIKGISWQMNCGP